MADNKILKNFIDKFRKSEQFAANVAIDVVSPDYRGAKIASLNKVQMSKGKDINDEELGKYSEGWGTYRESRGKQIEFIDLHFTSQFYDSIVTEGKLISPKVAGLEIDASGEHWDNIKDRFDTALGLNETDRDKVGNMIALEVQKSLLKYYTP